MCSTAQTGSDLKHDICEQGAEEFRDAKRSRDGVDGKMQPLPPSKRQRGVAFGSGVADEDDVYGMVSFTVSHLRNRTCR